MRRTSLAMVHELARLDPRVVYIGSDLGAGTLDEMREEFPDRFFMEGISEANIIGMAAGLAMDGYIPYVNTIATFLTRRCYEQNAIDLCLHKLPVRLIANGGGLVYAPLGPTHIAIEDIALTRALPNMTVIVVSDAEEMQRMMRCSLDVPGPMYIRLGKGGDDVISRDEDGFEIGRAICRGDKNAPITIVATGVMTARCLDAVRSLEDRNIAANLIHMHTVKPLDTEAIISAASRSRLIVTVEEHSRIGGLGSAVAETLCDDLGLDRTPRLLRLALPDAFPEHYGSQDSHLEQAGLQPLQIAERIANAWETLETKATPDAVAVRPLEAWNP